MSIDFYARYEALCRIRGIDPCSQKTAILLGATRGGISSWKTGTKPNIEKLRAAADLLNTSSDYLLGRTDDPEDFTTKAKADDAQSNIPKDLLLTLSKLDALDMERVFGFVLGLSVSEKYKNQNQSSPELSEKTAM